MSIESALARVAEIQSALASSLPPAPVPASPSTAPGSFAGALQGAVAAKASAALGAIAPGGGVGARMVAIAQGELGVAEQPPGSNDSPRIAQYRAATAGAPGPGPWCAYFVSWVARQAGVPLGEQGQGFGSVDALWAWAQRSGRAFAPGSGLQPQPGDLVVFHEHVGLVEAVSPDGTLQTIEGNSSDRVARRSHRPTEAIGFVRLG
ncbi:MAG: CHAP domain-containing protein [Thermoleophilaceae bacterium]|nr:CHAP domain-containing protein [Thermoleophilaceae bacterium]